jgi:CheY-like chemotaxis protein
LAKDYRTRCSLDAVVVDDWVTFEGSEPLFDVVDYSGTSFPGFLSFAEHENAIFSDSYHILIMGKRLVTRTMLSQKICSIHHAVCACLETQEDVLEMMASARQHNHSRNFDFIFVDVTLENDGLDTIRKIREAGFFGRLIAVNYAKVEELPDLVSPDTADCQIRFPVPTRDLNKILLSESAIFRMVAGQLQHTDSMASGVSAEDLEGAITYHEGVDNENAVRDLRASSLVRLLCYAMLSFGFALFIFVVCLLLVFCLFFVMF